MHESDDVVEVVDDAADADDDDCCSASDMELDPNVDDVVSPACEPLLLVAFFSAPSASLALVKVRTLGVEGLG